MCVKVKPFIVPVCVCLSSKYHSLHVLSIRMRIIRRTYFFIKQYICLYEWLKVSFMWLAPVTCYSWSFCSCFLLNSGLNTRDLSSAGWVSQLHVRSTRTHQPLEKLVFLLQASFIPFRITSSSRSELRTATSPSLFFLAHFPLFVSFERRLVDMSSL